MIMKYFAVYDKKALSYGQLFPSNTLGTAERAFSESVRNPESPHNKHPGDFALYLIFDFDVDDGVVTKLYEPPQLVVEAAALSE